MNQWLRGACAILIAAGCASAPEPAGVTPRGAAAAPEAARDIPPSGFGTLRQDEFTVDLRAGAVHLRVTPLDQAILHLAAPDTERRLASLAASRGAGGVDPSGAPAPFLVAFFARDAGQTFEPGDVVIESSGREFRPARIVPLTPGWGEQRLQQQQQEMAIYLFDGTPDLSQPMTIRYGSAVSREWETIIPGLQAERARVLVRAASPEARS